MPGLFGDDPEALVGYRLPGVACRCGCDLVRIGWQEMAGGRRHLRAECVNCTAFVKYLEQRPEWVRLAR